ncbi:Hsp70 family protein [Acinetobacter rathckeae]|uniref:Hsp70 family protein n=1 Tax=Acinetobacter rathckeae TaxID=2605272 RepID=UPI0018A3181B|nr:Hsp70 family protein [Acinetobacter rathckeae]MBF7686729.1 Hsp70 family protein [Acinetobacter rathckeae]MBF7695738.1 Hsp70 family protein [Acinetobacter rathckeae]
MTEIKPLIGIDLGTSNSLVGVFENGQPRLIENAYGNKLTPSAIAMDEDQQILIGQAALELCASGQDVLTCFKRLMGTSKQLKLGDRSFSAVELSSLILRSLKQDAEHALQCKVDEAVITVPAYFNDIQRQATISAAELAGLKVSRLINEPTAAALAYGLGQSNDSCFLIFDLGGGTFDVSIVELFDGVIEVRASAGDNYLGGDDFVQLLMKQFWKKNASLFAYSESTIPYDVEIALKAKAQYCLHVLSKQASTQLNFKWRSHEATLEISQNDLINWAEPLLLRLRRPLERALRDARISPKQVDQIIMVGGATRIPAVRKLVTKLFGRFPSTSVQPDEAIVRGACIQAGLKAKDQSLKEVVLTDVCPFSLGIAVGDEGQFSPILERNIVIPASKVNTYTAMSKGQKEIVVQIYQGEHRLCRENISLGALNVSLPKNDDYLSIDVRFSYNPNGILDVDVYVPATGEKLQKVVVNHQSVMSAEDIEKSRLQLQSLKIHPRDNLINKSLVLRAERLYSERTGDLRSQIGERTERFNQILNLQDERQIREARPYFEAFLNEVEDLSLFDDY